MENYEWKSIPEWEWYQACPQGFIRRDPVHNIYKKKKPEDLIRTPMVNKKTGYTHTRLGRLGESRSFSIHRIIAEMFVPNPHNYKEVDHINRDKQDNRAENLRWCTRRENMRNMGEKKAIKPIMAFPPDGSAPLYFECIRDAAEALQKMTGERFFPQGISNVLNKAGYTHYKRWKFKVVSAVN